MGARIQNTPNYVVYDQSYSQSVSVASSGGANGAVMAGSPAEVIDKDLSTFYQYGKITTAANGDYDIIIDYGRPIWNATLWIKCGAQGNTKTLDYSSDGSSWTTQQADGTFTGDPVTFNFNLLTFQYLRLRAHKTSGTDAWVKIYECRLMGSA